MTFEDMVRSLLPGAEIEPLDGGIRVYNPATGKGIESYPVPKFSADEIDRFIIKHIA